MRTAGSGWQGQLYYSTSGHPASEAYTKLIANTTVLNEWRVLEWDMAALTVGGTDWVNNTITALRFDLGTSTSDVFKIDWITVGSISPVAYSAAIQTEATTRVTDDNKLFAQYTVKLDVNGKVSGYGLASTGPTGTGSTFEVRADKFVIAAPTGSEAGYVPFSVLAVPTVVGGITLPAGVYAQNAFIQDAQITNAKIADLAVDNAKIANLSAAKITAGAIGVGSYIQSTAFTAGSAGWKINADGTAELANAVVRGTVYATAGQIGGNTIDSTSIHSGTTGYGTGAGFYLGSDGKFSLSDKLTWSGTTLSINGGGTFSGALSAATGTFAGSLSAATGSFSGSLTAATGSFAGSLSAATGSFAGSLSAATGTFSGTLTASAINAVNTLNIAGEAVTVPRSGYAASINSALTPIPLSFSVDAGGAPIWITASGFCPIGEYGSSGDADWVVMSIWVDGVRVAITNGGGAFTMALSISGGGSRLIQLRAGHVIANSAYNVSLFAIGTKR
jgi:hypothetical protein